MSIVITLSRQLGSRGSYIGTAVAKKLNLRYIDREILSRAAEMAGYPDEAMVTQLEKMERVPGFLENIINSMNTMPAIPTIASATLREGYAYDERLATLMVQEGLSRDEAFRELSEHERRAEAGEAYQELVKRVILEYAQMGNVIIVGRGGQVVLKDFANVLHVRIHAPEELRILRLAERLGIDQKEAERQVRQSDKERARYMKHFYDVKWDDPDFYHLIVNTGKLSVDLATQLICDAAQRLALSAP
ncbi:MAG TPA: cytidylate kinase-like family protein [Anaerolineae bacterium]|nr:cytidylate kinase-like family protein [Anaerolineae bacterium]HQK15496.1 cytidylate kinase-like family protein [Anaerolineae bacterium]